MISYIVDKDGFNGYIPILMREENDESSYIKL